MLNSKKDTAGHRRSARLVSVVALVSLVAVAVSAYRWWSSDERAVKNRLADVAATLTSPAHDTAVARLARIARLRGFLAEDIRVHAGAATTPEIRSRDAVLALLARSIPSPGGMTVEFVDAQVTLEPGGEGARVYLTAKVSGRDPRTGEPTLDAREANVNLAKRAGDWVITNVETVETLQRP